MRSESRAVTPHAAAMAGYQKVQKVMTQPINLIFRFLQTKARVQIWLFEQANVRLEGRILVRRVWPRRGAARTAAAAALMRAPRAGAGF